MRMTVSEMAKLSGVSVRTLHYYDEIGLLRPAEVARDTGYRYYDQAAVKALQQIMFYRELHFPLKDIREFMASPEISANEALQGQRELLLLERQRLDRLIQLCDAHLKGETDMTFQAFDKTDIEKAKDAYAAEVKERWGDTEAYRQSQQKGKDPSDTNGMDELLKEFAGHIGEAPEAPEVQRLVSRWQSFITENYYDCKKEILAGLGQMYVADERFTANMDKFGAGTAKLMSDAIAVYCK